jgi:hypothetical protein
MAFSTGLDNLVVTKYVTTAVSVSAMSIDIINLADISNFIEEVLFIELGLFNLGKGELKINYIGLELSNTLHRYF